jgi:HTH-type transcriptional regulator/antitoxin HipB
MEKMREVAIIVKYHRRKAGLSQETLSKLAGVGKTAVFDLEKGKETIQLDTLGKILKVLNITMKLESPLMQAYEREVANEKS